MKNLLSSCASAVLIRSAVAGFLLATGAASGARAAAPYEMGTFQPGVVPIEIQAWWAHTPDNGQGFGHIHVLCYWPIAQPVGDSIDTNCRITLHNNPGTLTVLRFDLAPGDTVASIDLRNLAPGNAKSGKAQCFYDGVTASNCSWNVPVHLDTTKWYTGWNHLRVRATVKTPDGHKWATSSEIPINVRGETGVRDSGFAKCIKNCLIGKGWYEGFDYQSVIVKGVPTEPVKGTLNLTFATKKGSAQLLQVMMDRSHIIPAVGPWNAEPHLADGPELLKIATPPDQREYPVSIDTTKLENGWHSLAVRNVARTGGIAECSYCDKEMNFQTGVAKFYFFVQN
jgi:hypothetical protein